MMLGPMEMVQEGLQWINRSSETHSFSGESIEPKSAVLACRFHDEPSAVPARPCGPRVVCTEDK